MPYEVEPRRPWLVDLFAAPPANDVMRWGQRQMTVDRLAAGILKSRYRDARPLMCETADVGALAAATVEAWSHGADDDTREMLMGELYLPVIRTLSANMVGFLGRPIDTNLL